MARFGAQRGRVRLLGFVCFAGGRACPQGDSKAPPVDAFVFIPSFFWL